MIFLWTWGGIFFGYRKDNYLWTHDGKNVGKFYDNEVYDMNGEYLGEIRNENRLIINLNKGNYRKPPFTPYADVIGIVPYANYVGYVMYVGHEDFHLPEDL